MPSCHTGGAGMARRQRGLLMRQFGGRVHEAAQREANGRRRGDVFGLYFGPEFRLLESLTGMCVSSSLD